jgi:hypothetical protein
MWKTTLRLESRTGSAKNVGVPYRNPRVNGTALTTAHRCSSAARFVQPEFVRLTHAIAVLADSSLQGSRNKTLHQKLELRRSIV